MLIPENERNSTYYIYVEVITGKMVKAERKSSPNALSCFPDIPLSPHFSLQQKGKGTGKWDGWETHHLILVLSSSPFIQNPVSDGSRQKVTVGHKPAKLMLKSIFLFVIRNRNGNSPE